MCTHVHNSFCQTLEGKMFNYLKNKINLIFKKLNILKNKKPNKPQNRNFIKKYPFGCPCCGGGLLFKHPELNKKVCADCYYPFYEVKNTITDKGSSSEILTPDLYKEWNTPGSH